MNTATTSIFPNYLPLTWENKEMNIFSETQIVEQIWKEVFLILHDYESPNKISDFLTRMKEKYQHIVEDDEILASMDEYNLVDIFNEVHNNLYYVGNTRGQLELIEKFNISSFDMLYTIIDTIWMTSSLHWKTIDMPIDKFSLLVQYIEHYNTKYFTQEDYILMAQDLEYHDLVWLYSGLNALNLADGITSIEFSYTDTVNILMFTHTHVSKKLLSDEILSIHDLKIIYENYLDTTMNNKKLSFRSLKILLWVFGYEIKADENR